MDDKHPTSKNKPGPTEERLKIDADWEEAAKVIAKAPPAPPDEDSAKEEKPKPKVK